MKVAAKMRKLTHKPYMHGYTKLFGSIIHSTIWQESAETKVVWVTMLAMADQHGEVQASVPGLARAAGVTIEQTEAALERLSSPDPYSRTPDHDGRRIEKIDGGWSLVNHSKYKFKMSAEDKREKWKEDKRRQRGMSTDVHRVHQSPHTQTHTHTQTKEQIQGASAFELPEWVPVTAWCAFIEQRKKLRKAPTEAAMVLLVNKLAALRAGGHDPKQLIELATENGWQSFYAPRENYGQGKRNNTPSTDDPFKGTKAKEYCWNSQCRREIIGKGVEGFCSNECKVEHGARIAAARTASTKN